MRDKRGFVMEGNAMRLEYFSGTFEVCIRRRINATYYGESKLGKYNKVSSNFRRKQEIVIQN